MSQQTDMSSLFGEINSQFYSDLIQIKREMKRLVSHQSGKENDRLYSHSNKRKIPKSPIKIREKIKQLEQKMQRQVKRVSLSKQKSQKEDGETHLKGCFGAVVAKKIERIPLQHLEREKEAYGSKDKKVSNLISLTNHQKQTPRVQRKQNNNCKIVAQKQVLSQKDVKAIECRGNANTQNEEEDRISRLRQQNITYKKVYSHSLERMQCLQEKLKRIKMQHQKQKNLLQGTMDDLKRKISDKKYNIGHLYTYREQNYMLLHDRIITETDNENSSSILENISKRFQLASSFSKLSIESK